MRRRRVKAQVPAPSARVARCHAWCQVHPAHHRGVRPHVAKSRRTRSMCCGVLVIAACQILSAAISCVHASWVMNTLVLLLLPQCRHREDAGYCLLFLPRSYVNMHWNYFMSGYRVIFRLRNWGILWPRVYFVDYGQGIIIPPVRKSILSCHRIPEMLGLGKNLSKSDDTVFSGKSPLHWDTTEEGTLISCLHLIRLVDI